MSDYLYVKSTRPGPVCVSLKDKEGKQLGTKYLYQGMNMVKKSEWDMMKSDAGMKAMLAEKVVEESDAKCYGPEGKPAKDQKAAPKKEAPKKASKKESKKEEPKE